MQTHVSSNNISSFGEKKKDFNEERDLLRNRSYKHLQRYDILFLLFSTQSASGEKVKGKEGNKDKGGSCRGRKKSVVQEKRFLRFMLIIM